MNKKLLALALSAVFGFDTFAGASHPSLAFLTRGWVWPSTWDLSCRRRREVVL